MQALTLALLLAGLAQGGPIEDGARGLAARITAHLTPQERVHLVTRNISALPAADATRARSSIEAALPKRPRAKTLVDVTLTFSQNAAGYLWVAEIHKGEVEMVAVKPPIVASAAPPLITQRLLWQQGDPLLDFVQIEERKVMLSVGNLSIVQAAGRADLTINTPQVRDPRGHLEIDGNSLTAYFPGATCRGTLEPLHLDCDGSTADFRWNDLKVHFTPGRNTLDGVRQEEENASVCGAMKLMAVKESVVALWSQNGAVVDQTELPGTITALWPSVEGAVVVIHNLNSEQYAAYALSVDCGSHL